MINRLGIVIHWVGFICSLVIGFYIFVLFTNQGMDVADVIGRLWRVMTFERRREVELSVFLWVTISHLPIKFIITGNKKLFPWSA